MKNYFSQIAKRRFTSSSHHTSRSRSTIKQSGQVILVVLAFSAILGAGLLSIYNTAQLSAEKRELVNSADAAAYSGAAILAQGLNYTAYTNRAILANNALIGQMVAIRSTLSMSEWYWKNSETAWRMIAGLTRLIPYLGAAASVISNVAAKFSDFWGGKVVYPVKVLAEMLQVSSTAAVGITNHALWLSQQVHMADSIISFEPNMLAIAKDNSPDADVDWYLHGTAFGPLVTLGSFASKFKIKARSSERTVGNRSKSEGQAKGKGDEYLNYITETNRAIQTAYYTLGRNLIPNAMGLWIATGCDTGASNIVGGASGAFAPAAGFGGGLDTAVKVMDTFASVLSVIANPVMCMFERHGGSELVQNEDGKFSWVAIDATAFKLLHWHLPFAGGSVASFVNPKEYDQRQPDSIKYFIDRIKRSGGDMAFQVNGNAKKKYFGHQIPLRPDCVEYVNPVGFHFVTVSTDGRVTGTCAVLFTGVGDHYLDGGLFGNNLDGTANKIIRSRMPPSPSAAMVAGVTDAATAAGLNIDSALGSLQTPNLPTPAGPSTQMQPGVSGQASGATTSSPQTQDMAAAGESLMDWGSLSSSARTALLGLTSGVNNSTFYVDPEGVINNSLSPSDAGRDGGPNWWQRLLLQPFNALIDVDALIAMMRLKISDGIERPRSEPLNKAFHLLADGLPPFFWDVRTTEEWQSGKPYGAAEDLVYTDEDPKDYHDARYNLGPLVYLPIIKPSNTTKTAAQSNIGGSMMGLPDYQDGNRSGLRAIGKARIFFRDPADHWVTRWNLVKTSSLILPYWQVRNESLSYVDKAALLLADGLVPAIFNQ
jgi:hypothetical protein